MNNNCARCNVEVAPMEMFPKNYCMDCHAATTEMWTAEQLVAVWSGKPLR